MNRRSRIRSAITLVGRDRLEGRGPRSSGSYAYALDNRGINYAQSLSE